MDVDVVEKAPMDIDQPPHSSAARNLALAFVKDPASKFKDRVKHTPYRYNRNAYNSVLQQISEKKLVISEKTREKQPSPKQNPNRPINRAFKIFHLFGSKPIQSYFFCLRS